MEWVATLADTPAGVHAPPCVAPNIMAIMSARPKFDFPGVKLAEFNNATAGGNIMATTATSVMNMEMTKDVQKKTPTMARGRVPESCNMEWVTRVESPDTWNAAESAITPSRKMIISDPKPLSTASAKEMTPVKSKKRKLNIPVTGMGKTSVTHQITVHSKIPNVRHAS